MCLLWNNHTVHNLILWKGKYKVVTFEEPILSLSENMLTYLHLLQHFKRLYEVSSNCTYHFTYVHLRVMSEIMSSLE